MSNQSFAVLIFWKFLARKKNSQACKPDLSYLCACWMVQMMNGAPLANIKIERQR